LAGSCAAQWVGACRGGVGRRHHWFAHSTGGKADMPLAMMATIVQGDAGTASPTVGVLVHLVLSALIGAVFALVVPRLRTNGTVAVAGTAYGLLLYVVNTKLSTWISCPGPAGSSGSSTGRVAAPRIPPGFDPAPAHPR
jgi:ABC-type branched-subunit amino acid transport system permease subunit